MKLLNVTNSNDALKIFIKQYPYLKPGKVKEYKSFFLIDYTFVNGERKFMNPIAINKNDGKTFTVNPLDIYEESIN